MRLEVTCMGCGKVEEIEVERGKHLHSGWAYFGTLRRGIGDWSHSVAVMDEKGKLKHDNDGMIVWKKCHPWWRELKYKLIDFKRLLLHQYKDIEMWECPDCQEVIR